MNNKKNYLLKNTAIFALGNFSTKLIGFFLVPYYTYVLTTNEYGVINLIFTICTVISPFLMLNLQDAVRRFLLEKDAKYNSILTTEWIVIIIGHIIGICLIPCARYISIINDYAIIIYFYLVTSTTNVILLEYLRGREKMMSYTVCNVFSSLCIAILNIVFLTKYRLGIKGYFLSFIIAYFLSNLLAIVLGKQYDVIKKWNYDKKITKSMIYFSLPLIPNTLLWWVSSSADHIMVTNLIGAAANGIYTISYKIPTLISTVSNIFMQAWQISAIKEEGDQEFSNKMFDAYMRFNVLLSAGLLLIIKPFMKIYVSANYFSAWKYTPFLIIGYAFSTLGTFVGTPYYVYKDMKGNMWSAGAGALINIILNIILIPTIGIQGAAIATCLSYVVVFIYRCFDTRKYTKINFDRNRSILYLSILIAMLVICFIESGWHYIVLLVLVFIILYENQKFIIGIVKSFIKK